MFTLFSLFKSQFVCIILVFVGISRCLSFSTQIKKILKINGRTRQTLILTNNHKTHTLFCYIPSVFIPGKFPGIPFDHCLSK